MRDYDNRRKWFYSLHHIAELTGQSDRAIREHKRLGKVVPSQLLSVIEYVAGKRGIMRAKTKKAENPNAPL